MVEIGEDLVLEVTQDNLDNGSSGDPGSCPVAWAMADHFDEPLWRFTVGSTMASRWSEARGTILEQYMLMRDAIRLIRLVDSGSRVEGPATVTLRRIH
jgi:hypothetical protein